MDGSENDSTLHIGQLQEPIPGWDNIAYHNGRPFSTYDNDNDGSNWEHCALSSSYSDRGRGAGWWFNECSAGVLIKNDIF